MNKLQATSLSYVAYTLYNRIDKSDNFYHVLLQYIFQKQKHIIYITYLSYYNQKIFDSNTCIVKKNNTTNVFLFSYIPTAYKPNISKKI